MFNIRRGHINAVYTRAYTNLSKAFDNTGHIFLLNKLFYFGNNSYLLLIQSYLHQIYVATSGFPHGYNLGPLFLFLEWTIPMRNSGQN